MPSDLSLGPSIKLGRAVTCVATAVSNTYNIPNVHVISPMSLLLLRYNVVHSGGVI
jgi:hypothetical protein